MGDLLLSKARIKALILFSVLLFSLLAAQLVRVQVIQAAEYQSKASKEMQLTRTIPAPRGDITDINGITFARSVSAITVVVDQVVVNVLPTVGIHEV